MSSNPTTADPIKVPRPQWAIPEPKTGVTVDGKPVVQLNTVEAVNPQPSKATNPPSKGLYGTAIAVGILLVLGGVFGGLGLLQSHYHFLPASFDWLAKAVTFVGNLGPHHAVLWALAAGGVLGIVAMAGGSVKVHPIRMEEKRMEEKRMEEMEEQERNRLVTVLTTNKGHEAEDLLKTATPEDLKKGSEITKTTDEIVDRPEFGKVLSAQEKAQNKLEFAQFSTQIEKKRLQKAKTDAKAEAAAQTKTLEEQKVLEAKAQELEARKAAAANLTDDQLEAMLGDVNGLKIEEKYTTALSESQYMRLAFKEEGVDKYLMIIKIPEGSLKYTGRLTLEERDKLEKYLTDTKKYTLGALPK